MKLAPMIVSAYAVWAGTLGLVLGLRRLLGF
jgi:hypothetical protein